jgi:hypothetical protein
MFEHGDRQLKDADRGVKSNFACSLRLRPKSGIEAEDSGLEQDK